eukprot:TRINITY_DN56555_c0_g2_i2.p1 TRINITY_DN56555_c0_g2~~TRINITY_DN56555_c0_g2_i2.p1  ORF type:complete len:314 (+),score=74.80 TRINITY_DN56555_c0_g2_i2:103-942(+)
MLRSLVGSEMCIRDSHKAGLKSRKDVWAPDKEFTNGKKFASFVHAVMLNCAHLIKEDAKKSVKAATKLEKVTAAEKKGKQYPRTCFWRLDDRKPGTIPRREAGGLVHFLFNQVGIGSETPSPQEVNALVVGAQQGGFQNDRAWFDFFACIARNASDELEVALQREEQLATQILEMAADVQWMQEGCALLFTDADIDLSGRLSRSESCALARDLLVRRELLAPSSHSLDDKINAATEELKGLPLQELPTFTGLFQSTVLCIAAQLIHKHHARQKESRQSR